MFGVGSQLEDVVASCSVVAIYNANNQRTICLARNLFVAKKKKQVSKVR